MSEIREPFLEQQDIFPPCTLTKAHIAAYKDMEQAGDIAIDKILMNKTTGVAIFRYRSINPHEWVLEDLKRRKAQHAMEQTSLDVGG